MAEPRKPAVYSIAAHRGFADALAAGLISRYNEDDLGLARLTLLLPNRRAAAAITEAFVRLSDGGLLMPRMVMIGDADLGEALGSLFEPLGGTDDDAIIPPAVDADQRLLYLAYLLYKLDPSASLPARLRRARQFATTIDQLLIEGMNPDDLLTAPLPQELQQHWVAALRQFLIVQSGWQDWLDERGLIDLPDRRNQLLDATARRWRDDPPDTPIVAAGITSASPAIARLLRIVSELPRGGVVLPDLDLSLDDDIWEALGNAGAPVDDGAMPFPASDETSHPQYHLKLLLNRMGVNRGELQPWHRSGAGASPPQRARAISNLFLPAEPSRRWATMPSADRRMTGVRLLEAAHQGEEALAIAILMREALATPERRVALVTPDRELSRRVIAQLARWNITADDTAGMPLSLTAPGALMLALAQLLASDFAALALLTVLKHPLVHEGEGRADWMDNARALDLALRGPRTAQGLAAIRVRLDEAQPSLVSWWDQVATKLSGLAAFVSKPTCDLAELLCAMGDAATKLCGDTIWRGEAGRTLAALIQRQSAAASLQPTELRASDLPDILRDWCDDAAVRLPYGSHPRVAIYGLLEARMQRADLMICGGLTEGVWPAVPSIDPVLAPAILRSLGMPGAELRIGLAAHDLAAALGAPDVVLSYAQRDADGPVRPSRFLLRLRAMLDDIPHETQALALARSFDHAEPAPPHPRPQPRPSAEQRKVQLSATGIGTLRSDPYQFYAKHILRLKRLDGLDEEPDDRLKGTLVHEALERWQQSSASAEGQLPAFLDQALQRLAAHPLAIALMRGRLMAGAGWIDAETQRLRTEGRRILGVEVEGDISIDGIRVTGKADRIDRLLDNSLAIIDFKTGAPPSAKSVQEGYDVQLGLLGMLAADGGFESIKGIPTRFEYWSFGRNDKSQTGFGYSKEPVLEGRKNSGIPRDQYLSVTRRYVREAISDYIIGSQPFTARIKPDLKVYTDYDQLMRLDEWIAAVAVEDPSQ